MSSCRQNSVSDPRVNLGCTHELECTTLIVNVVTNSSASNHGFSSSESCDEVRQSLALATANLIIVLEHSVLGHKGFLLKMRSKVCKDAIDAIICRVIRGSKLAHVGF